MFGYIHVQIVVFIRFLLLFTIVKSIINLYKEMNECVVIWISQQTSIGFGGSNAKSFLLIWASTNA